MAAYDRRAITDLFDVDDGPMLRNRQMVMAVCVVQVSVAILLGLLQAARRRGAILLILNPFFIAAGVLGYLGAKRCQPVLVMAHFTGSAGLSLLFGFFILAESFLKRSGQDLFVFFINFPMDLFLLSTAGFSVTLYLSLVKYHAALKEHRQQMREHFQLLEAGERGGGGGAGGGAGGGGSGGSPRGPAGGWAESPGPAGRAGSAARARLEQLPRDEPPIDDAAGLVGGHGHGLGVGLGAGLGVGPGGLRDDLRCPISLEVMRDPVMAADGHSYERASIERWLAAHRTSPMTGRVLPHTELVPNHRLRGVIDEIVGEQQHLDVRGMV